MRVVVQRVTEAYVAVDGHVAGSIGEGLLLLIGIHEDDTERDAVWLAQKILNLRIFEDEAGKMNYSVSDTHGALLCISQFTLIAEYKKGNRPSFIRAANPDKAIPLFEYFKSALSESGLTIASGIFGADMKVTLVNDGPVTITLDSLLKI